MVQEGLEAPIGQTATGGPSGPPVIDLSSASPSVRGDD